jgi:hypothetical protein
MWLMAAGIRTSTTTDWLPNAGIARSSDRTAPGRTSRFSAPDRSPAGNAWCLGSPRESRARQASCDRRQQSPGSAPLTGLAPRSNSFGSRGWWRPVPQVRVRSLGANLGPTVLRRACQVRLFSRTLRRPGATAFLPTFFITFFSYPNHRLAPQSLRRYLSVHRRELRSSPETNPFPAANFLRAL